MDKSVQMQFKNSMYNATIFTYNYNLSVNNLLAKFFPEISNEFDGTPIIPDFPDGFPIPQEIPRLTLVNKNKNLRLEIYSFINFLGYLIEELPISLNYLFFNKSY